MKEDLNNKLNLGKVAISDLNMRIKKRGVHDLIMGDFRNRDVRNSVNVRKCTEFRLSRSIFSQNRIYINKK